MLVLVTLPVLGRHTVSLLNFKNKTSFPPLNYVPALKRDKKGYTTQEDMRYGTDYNAAAAQRTFRPPSLLSRTRQVAGARRARQFFILQLIFQFSGTLETDGLAAAIRNDRSPLQRYILKNKQIPGSPGSPAWLCELVPVQ